MVTFRGVLPPGRFSLNRTGDSEWRCHSYKSFGSLSPVLTPAFSMPPSFQVIDDTVVPHGGSYDTITPREQTVRNAMLVVTIVAPILGSFIIWLFSRKGWSYRSSWSYPRLAILWFWCIPTFFLILMHSFVYSFCRSVAIFGTLVFYQRGTTNRTVSPLPRKLHIDTETPG